MAALLGGGGQVTSEGELNALMSTVATVIMAEARRCLPARRRPERRSNREAKKLRGWARCIRNMLAQVDRLVTDKATRLDRAFRAGIRAMQRLGIAPEGAELFQAEEWGEWGVAAIDVLQALTSKLARVHQRDPTRMQRLSARLWRVGRGNRAFFERLLRRGAQGKLDSAMDPASQTRTWDAARAKGLIADQVGAIFQHKVHLPRRAAEVGLCTGQCT